jgi:hypothetical protein
VSLGLAQKVFANLIQKGIIGVRGERTAKVFFFKKPKKLLADWEQHYNVIKRAKLRTYRTTLSGYDEITKIIATSPLRKNIALALHSAAKLRGFSHTNLNSVELYVLDKTKRYEIELLLKLEPQENGYSVLLIEPYYKQILKPSEKTKNLATSPDILTYLDLAHYPLRGREQADYLLQTSPILRKLKNDS